MPTSNTTAFPAFSDEEENQFSELLALRKADSAHFRRAFAALGEQQSRFLEYKEMKDSQAEKHAASKKEVPMLNGFYLSQQQGELKVQPNVVKARDTKRRRCTLL